MKLAGVTATKKHEARTRPLRFGVMCTGTRFPAWQARSITALLASDRVTPELLIVDAGGAPVSPSARMKKLALKTRRLAQRRGRLWPLYERAVIRRSVAERPVDLSGALSDVPVIRCAPIRRGKYSQYFSTGDIELIRSFDLDFILRFAFEIIRGDILTAARYGVWSFHHGDETKYRGSPAAFWEIVNHDPVTGSMLQRLTERLDAGIVLRRSTFKTIPHSWIENRDQVRLESAEWPALVCNEIRSGTAECYINAEPSATDAPIMLRPRARELARYLLIAARSPRTEPARAMTPDEMLAVYQRHRSAEDRHDFPAVMSTLAPDCFLEQVALGLRSEGKQDATRAYEEWFGAFPDLGPIPEGIAFGNDVLIAYGQLHGTMKGPWLDLAPTGREFTVPLVNIVPFKDGLMRGERLFYDAVMFSEQVGLDVNKLRAAASHA